MGITVTQCGYRIDGLKKALEERLCHASNMDDLINIAEEGKPNNSLEETKMSPNCTHMFLVGIFVLSVSPLKAQESGDSKPTQITASALVVRGMAATSSTFISINIENFTTDEKRNELLVILQEGGPDALRRALEKLDMGQLSTSGRIGVPIAVARAYQVEGGTLYNIVTARNISFFEQWRGGRSRDYPFSVAQIIIDDNGKGEGGIILAADIRFDEEAGRIVVESFGFQDTIRLTNVRREE